jgi:hypothetical protein
MWKWNLAQLKSQCKNKMYKIGSESSTVIRPEKSPLHGGQNDNL